MRTSYLSIIVILVGVFSCNCFAQTNLSAEVTIKGKFHEYSLPNNFDNNLFVSNSYDEYAKFTVLVKDCKGFEFTIMCLTNDLKYFQVVRKLGINSLIKKEKPQVIVTGLLERVKRDPHFIVRVESVSVIPVPLHIKE